MNEFVKKRRDDSAMSSPYGFEEAWTTAGKDPMTYNTLSLRPLPHGNLRLHK